MCILVQLQILMISDQVTTLWVKKKTGPFFIWA